MRVAVLYHPLCLEHYPGLNHPERPARLQAIVGQLEGERPAGIELMTPCAASVEQIAAVHSPDYIAEIERISADGGGFLDMDTVLSAHSYEAALIGAGSAISAVEAVLSGEASSAFALPRPPGHHAGPSYGMGFCLFNNVAIGVRHAQKAYAVKRVLLVDFDIHHGNGSQEILYDDPSVLYFSMHESPHYPGTGRVDETGAGPGQGYTLNVPLPAECGDVAYTRILQEILAPAARRFQPELIAVSAGYDGHWADPLADMRLSTSGFAAIASCLRDLAAELSGGRLMGVLEGGYDLRALAASVMATLQVWAAGEPEDPLGPYRHDRREPDVSSIIQRVRQIHNLV
ncbi:MAG: histone deacetylase [Chloroflexi bacterium]|nr:histone deacetylase [Chloroflexota bacterium]